MHHEETTEWMTAATQQRLRAELATLEERLAEEGERVRELAADTTWHGSNEVIPSVTRDMAALTHRIAAIKDALARAVLYDPRSVPTDAVGVGTRVVVSEEGAREEFSIVGPAETAPAEGRISPDSPVGRALLGHHAGDVVHVQTPGGSYVLRIEEISPAQ
jgi:transcription elongation factor GreA